MNLRPRPHQRVRIGRNIALVGAATYAGTRAIAYTPGIAGDGLAEPVALISLDGHLLWAWALAWAIAAGLCIMDMVEGHTRRGLALTVGLGAAWGAGYGAAWLAAGIIAGDWNAWWVTAVNYLTVCAIVWGLVYKTTALHDMANPAGMEDGAERD